MTRCCHPIPSEDRRNPPRVQVGCLIGKNAPPSKRSPYDAGVDSGFSTSSRYSSWKRLGVKSQIDFQEAGGVPHCLPTPSISRSHPAKSLRMPTAKGGERRAKDRGLDKRHIQFNIIYIMRSQGYEPLSREAHIAHSVLGVLLLSGTMVTRVENASPGVGDVAARPRSIAVAGSTDGLVIKPRVLLPLA